LVHNGFLNNVLRLTEDSAVTRGFYQFTKDNTQAL